MIRSVVIPSSIITPYRAGNLPQLADNLTRGVNKFLEKEQQENEIQILQSHLACHLPRGEEAGEHPALILTIFYDAKPKG